MRGTISGVQNVTLYCKIYIVIQLFQLVYKWSLALGLYKTLDPLFLYQIEPEILTLKNRLIVLGLFEHISNAHSCARSDNIKKNRTVIKTKERLVKLRMSFFFRQNDKRASVTMFLTLQTPISPL